MHSISRRYLDSDRPLAEGAGNVPARRAGLAGRWSDPVRARTLVLDDLLYRYEESLDPVYVVRCATAGPQLRLACTAVGRVGNTGPATAHMQAA